MILSAGFLPMATSIKFLLLVCARFIAFFPSSEKAREMRPGSPATSNEWAHLKATICRPCTACLEGAQRHRWDPWGGHSTTQRLYLNQSSRAPAPVSPGTTRHGLHEQLWD